MAENPFSLFSYCPTPADVAAYLQGRFSLQDHLTNEVVSQHHQEVDQEKQESDDDDCDNVGDGDDKDDDDDEGNYDIDNIRDVNEEKEEDDDDECDEEQEDSDDECDEEQEDSDDESDEEQEDSDDESDEEQEEDDDDQEYSNDESDEEQENYLGNELIEHYESSLRVLQETIRGRDRVRLSALWLGLYVDDSESEFSLELRITRYRDVLASLLASDVDTKRGAPPASKSVVEALLKETVEVVMECAVCMDSIDVGGSVTKLPCGHGYHGDCIVAWLEKRNSCPVCRFELETDDAEYEEARKGVGGGSSS